MATKGAKPGGARVAREKRIAAPDETADLKFRDNQRVSEYRDLLDDLQDAPKGSTLKIDRRARDTAVKHIRDLGLKVQWARRGDDLPQVHLVRVWWFLDLVTDGGISR